MSRNAIETALRKRFVPELRSRGFHGSLPHFRRTLPDRIDLLTVQFDKWGSRFVVEIARCGPAGVTTHSGQEIPPDKVSAHDVPPGARHRLGSPAPGEEGRWFRFDDGTPVEAVVDAASAMLEEADRWWEEHAMREEDLQEVCTLPSAFRVSGLSWREFVSRSRYPANRELMTEDRITSFLALHPQLIEIW